jgi:hypothetical protein
LSRKKYEEALDNGLIVWRNVGGEWVVANRTEILTPGSIVEVEAASGRLSTVEIIAHTGTVDGEHYYRYSEDRVQRVEKAMKTVQVHSINHKEKSGVFVGRTGDLYHAQIGGFSSRCDCKDFQERQETCKHLYRLEIELGNHQANDAQENPSLAGATWKFDRHWGKKLAGSIILFIAGVFLDDVFPNIGMAVSILAALYFCYLIIKLIIYGFYRLQQKSRR